MNRILRRFYSTRAVHNSWMCTEPYAPTNTLQLILPTRKAQTTVRIAKAFTPFTYSQALLVDVTTPTCDALPKQLILKLGDRRWAGRYHRCLDPWTPEIELEFQLYMARHFTEHGAYPTVNADKGITSNFPEGLDKDEDPPIWLTELWAWASGERDLAVEAKAYRRLVEAQHLGIIPRFYGEAEVIMSPETAPSHPAFQSIQGILIEHIPGASMDSVRIGEDITQEQAEEVSQKLITLGRQIRRYGVMHNDLHFGNIVLRSTDRTPVIIDWGEASFERADSPSLAERWNTPGIAFDYESGIRHWLLCDQKVPWHRHQTPYDDATWECIAQNHGRDEKAWKLINSWVRRNMEENEREGIYIEDTSVDEGRGLRWRIRPGIKTRQFTDPVPIN